MGNFFFLESYYQVTGTIFYYDNNVITYHFHSYSFLQSEGRRAFSRFWPCRCYEFSKAASENKRLSVALVKRAFILFTSFTDSDPRHTPAPPLFVWVTSASDSSIMCTVFTGTKGLVPTSAVHSPTLFFYSGGRVYEIVTLFLWEQSRAEANAV